VSAEEHWADYQRQLARCFANTGYTVAEVSNDASFAPFLHVQGGDRITAPDLILFGSRWRVPCYVDAKLKTEAPLNRNAGVRTTGINASHHRAYLRVQEATSQPVFLFFGHQKENEVRACWVSEETVPAMGAAAGEMIYWNYDHMTLVCTLDEVMDGVPFGELHLARDVQPSLFT